MDYPEFSELTHATVNQLLDRVPAKYRDGFESLLIGGELRKVMYQTVIKITQLIAAASRFEFLQYRQFYPCGFGKGHCGRLGNLSFVRTQL